MPLLPVGTYYAYQTSAVSAESQRGLPQVVITLRIGHMHDEHRLQDDQWIELPEPLERRLYLACSNKAWPWTQKKLAMLGFKGDFETMEFDPSIIAQGVELTCKHEEYQNRLRERWELANFGGGEAKALSIEDCKKLNALWRASEANAARNESAPHPPVQEDQGVPF